MSAEDVAAAGAAPADHAPIERSIVQDVMLATPRPVGRIQTRRITMQPNVAGGLHLHNGPVVGSIERGSAIYQVEGGVERTLEVGDTFYEEEGTRIARFDAGPDGVVFLAHFPVATHEEPTLTML